MIRLSGGEASRALDEGIRLQRPLSPHLSARLAGVSINLEDLVEIAMAQPPTRRWMVEGAGGILVPVNARDLMADLIARLAIPAVIVARSGLGTINHTLLTIEALRARTLSVAGVIMVGEPMRHNRFAIEESRRRGRGWRNSDPVATHARRCGDGCGPAGIRQDHHEVFVSLVSRDARLSGIRTRRCSPVRSRCRS